MEDINLTLSFFVNQSRLYNKQTQQSRLEDPLEDIFLHNANKSYLAQMSEFLVAGGKTAVESAAHEPDTFGEAIRAWRLQGRMVHPEPRSREGHMGVGEV